MTRTRANHSTHTARGGSASVLTQNRGKVRRTSEGVEKQQSELLAAEIRNDVPVDFLKSHIALMEGRPLPVISCLADHAPHIWATLAADLGK